MSVTCTDRNLFSTKTIFSKPFEVMLMGFQVNYIISQAFIFFVNELDITKMKIFLTYFMKASHLIFSNI